MPRLPAEKFETMSIRLPSKVMAWLRARATASGASINGEITDILKTVMTAQPTRVILRTFVTPQGTRFLAALDSSMDDFADEATEEAAYTKALDYLKGFGLGPRDVVFDYRREVVGFRTDHDLGSSE